MGKTSAQIAALAGYSLLSQVKDYLASRAANYAVGQVSDYTSRALFRKRGTRTIMPTYKRKRVYAKKGRRSFKRSFKRPYKAKRRRLFKRSRKTSTLKKSVYKLKKFMKQQQAIHIHRQRRVSRMGTGPKAAVYGEYSFGGTKAEIESAAANLRFYDPVSNGLVTGSAVAGTYSRDIEVSIARFITVKNNFQIPVIVNIYSCVPKNATADSVLTLRTSGLVDQGNPTNTSPLLNLKDSRDVTGVWNCRVVAKGELKPGRSMSAKSFSGSFFYNISTNDEHTIGFEKGQGGHQWVVRLTGVLGHGTTGTEVGTMDCALDIKFDTHFMFKYDAGKDLHDISIDDTSQATYTTGSVVSVQPIADNLSYSAT